LDDHHREGKSDSVSFRLEIQGFWSNETTITDNHGHPLNSFAENTLTTLQSNSFHLMSHRKTAAAITGNHFKQETHEEISPPQSPSLLDDKMESPAKTKNMKRKVDDMFSDKHLVHHEHVHEHVANIPNKTELLCDMYELWNSGIGNVILAMSNTVSPELQNKIQKVARAFGKT